MSVHSDDTDVLLCIPPDLFWVVSDSDEVSSDRGHPESLLVSDLICQVNDLEGRVCMIEKTFPEESMNNLRQMRQYGSADTLTSPRKYHPNSRSLQATPMKTLHGFSPCHSWKTSESSLSSDYKRHILLEPRRNMLTSNLYMSQKEKDTQALKEIDMFFQKKDNSKFDGKADDAIRNLQVPQCATLEMISLNSTKVTDLRKQLDDNMQEIERKLKFPGLEKIESEDYGNLQFIATQNKGAGDNCEVDLVYANQGYNNPDGAKRALHFDSPVKPATLTNGGDPCCTILNTVDCQELTTAENKADNETVGSKDVKNVPPLAYLWGGNNMNKPFEYEDPVILRKKLEEEKCRRMHCEDQIKHLQKGLLEEQQKVAVATRMDEEKNTAIGELTDGWNKLIGHWKQLEIQRNTLAKQILEEREQFKANITSTGQAMERYKVELSKALDLAHGYKEKCEAADTENTMYKSSFFKETDLLKKEVKVLKEDLQNEGVTKNKLLEQLQIKEEVCNQGRTKIADLNNQIRELKKYVKDMESEMATLRQEKEKSCDQYKEELSKTIAAEHGKKALLQQNEELKKREKMSKEEAKHLRDQIERTKLELKDFYQKQVENIVQEKLNEFQEQLRTAEKTLQKEIEKREKAATEVAIKQVEQIVEKHVLEMNLMEEGHREEAEQWQSRMAEYEEKMVALQRRLDVLVNEKSEIAHKLQLVMETQYKEALKIISFSESSPIPPRSVPQTGLLEKGLSRQMTFTLAKEGTRSETEPKQVFACDASSPSTTTDTPFIKDGQVTSREVGGYLTYRINETPQKIPPGPAGEEQQDNLRKYIETLLERPPGCPTEDTTFMGNDSLPSVPHWQEIFSEVSNQSQGKSGVKGQYSKRPWK